MFDKRSALTNCNQSSPDAVIAITEKPIPTLFQLAGWPDSFQDKIKKLAMALGLPIPTDYRTAAQNKDTTVFAVSPATWQCTSSNENLITDVNILLPEELYVTDLSHARTRIQISGTGSAKLLQNIMSTDFSPEIFKPGNFVQSCIHDMSVLVYQQPFASKYSGEPKNHIFDLLVSRSYAVSLWNFLTDHLR